MGLKTKIKMKMNLKEEYLSIPITSIIAIAIALFCLPGCGAKRGALESVVESSDSSAAWSVEEQLRTEIESQKHSSENVELNMNSLKEMDLNFSNDRLTREIIYSDDKIDAITGKPQISREIYSISSSLLEKRIGEFEKILQESRKATELNSSENSSLSLSADKLVKENKYQVSKSASIKRFNYIHLLISFALGCLISLFINKS